MKIPRLLNWLYLWIASTALLQAQLSSDRLLKAEEEPQNWLTYSGSYKSQHFSKLNQITRDNVGDLELKWVYQANLADRFEATPLVVEEVMYLVSPPNDVVALGANSGRPFWTYQHTLPQRTNTCCGRVNRGLAMLGYSLFMGTVDGHLLAVDSRTGNLLWDVEMADHRQGYSLTAAPLAVKDKVILGTAGGEYGIRGYLDAYDAKTGKRVWRFYTIPGPGEAGHETWQNDAWKHGGGPVWLTGSYDPELNLTYWGVGNPGPDFNGDVRPGDNLYTASVIALDADTGKLKWHFQFTPHDEWDFDAAQIPVLVDRRFHGRQRKLMLWGNRNGFFYVLDRESGEFLLGKPFARQTWALGLDENGRPIVKPGSRPTPEGSTIYPGLQGATNWYAPSYSPQSDLFYLPAWMNYSSTFYKREAKYSPGNRYVGGWFRSSISPIERREIPRGSFESEGYGAVLALDPSTGEKKWEFKMVDVTDSGLLSTAGGILFSGSRAGNFFALDAGTGKVLWTRYLGGQIAASTITFLADGEQLISVVSGHAVFTFGLKTKRAE